MVITRTNSALKRWSLFYNVRTVIDDQNHAVLHKTPGYAYHTESAKPCQNCDNEDERALVTIFKECKVFTSTFPETLQNIFSKDLATDEIQQ